MTDQIKKQDTKNVNQLAIRMNESDYFDLMQRQSKLFASSEIVPKAYQNNMPNCFIALDMARRLNCNPMILMQSLYIVHGNPGWSAQFLIAMINSSKRFTPLKFKFSGTPDTDAWACVAYCKDKDTGEELVGAKITIKMAKAEGWYSKNGSKWQTMPEQMMMYRSASFFARVYSPETTMGIGTQEEAIEMGEIKQVREIGGPAFMEDASVKEEEDVPMKEEKKIDPLPPVINKTAAKAPTKKVAAKKAN